MKQKIEDVESYETKNKGHWVLWNKKRALSPMKVKTEDVESYESWSKGRWVLWN